VSDFLQGATALASVSVALFFWKYWRSTGDRLFMAFSLAFVVFGLNRVLLSVLDPQSEARTWIYLVRALTFVLIAAAVVDKNLGRQHRSDHG
jgi:NADH:ubiquinone oxidoreductase subunit 3 (subunit A)